MADSLVRFVQVIYRACWTIVDVDNFIIPSMELLMPFLLFKSGNGRWRHRRQKLDNFSAILQQNKEIFPHVHLSRMLGEYLNYDTTHIMNTCSKPSALCNWLASMQIFVFSFVETHYSVPHEDA